MAEDQENGVEAEAEEELDIDALLDDVAEGGEGGPEDVEDEAAVDVDSVLDDAVEDAPAEGADEIVAEDDIDAIMDDVASEPETPAEEEVIDEITEVADEPAAPTAPAESPAPAAAPSTGGASSAELDGVVARLNAAVEKSEFITQQLEERHSAAERFVKGVKEASKELKADQASIGDVEKNSKLGMILGGVTLLLSGAVLGLVVTEDKETMLSQVETVSASVDGVGENVNLIAGRIFEQQQQMDEAMASFASLKEALEKLESQPAPAPAPATQDPVMVEGGDGVEGGEAAMPEVAVDFTVVEEKIDETQQKILALHEQIKSSEAHLPELKAYLEQLSVGQQQLRQEQERLMQLQQMMLEAKERGKTIYKFP